MTRKYVPYDLNQEQTIVIITFTIFPKYNSTNTADRWQQMHTLQLNALPWPT